MASTELFDPQKIAEIESEPTILGFLLYSATINEHVSNYFTKSSADLNDLTGENICLFFVGADEERREETIEEYEIDLDNDDDERVMGFFVEMRRIEAPKVRRVRRRNVYAVAALGDHFLESEYFRMPCLVFFSHFDSKQFYVYEVDHLSNEEIAKLIMKLSTEAKDVWKDRAVPDGGEMRQRIRQQTYDQFIPSLKRVAAKERLKSITKDATILTILGSALGGLM